MSELWYGGDYNPEQWAPEVWAEDVELMRRAGVNLVTLGVFAWSSLEPSSGRYSFGWLDEVLDLLHRNGIRVDLATPTASPPPWFSLAHPDALPVRADGVRLTHGSRDTYCACAPAYREAAAGIARALGERYAGHPAVAMWHVHNEYGTVCYCEHAASSFRRWLRARYESLEQLNAAWTTAFWGQGYWQWEEIQPPRATQYLENPTQALDFRRFWSDELLAAFLEQKAILGSFSDLPITTNFVFGPWVPVNHARWAAEVDLVAIDHYPTDAGIGAEQQTALGADLARSWAGEKPWLLMEQAAGGLNTGRRWHTKEPGRMTRHSLSHVARGSRGALFFQWRASRGGAEMWHSALVPHTELPPSGSAPQAGVETRRFREVAELGALLPRLAEADAGQVQAEVAILWDAESWWAMQSTHLPSSDLDYLAAVQAAHRQVWAAGVGADLPGPEAELSAYKLVIVPSLYLVSDAAAESITRYVEAGGHVVVTYLSGIADQNAQVRLGGYPGAFRDLLGIRVEEFHPTDEVQLTSGAHGSLWSENIHLTDAEAVDTYPGGTLDGYPAITRNTYGNGTAWYISTQLDDEAYSTLLRQAMDTAGINLPDLPAGVELVRRESGGTTWKFLINHSAEEVTVPADGFDLVTGEEVVGSVDLPPGGWAVVRSSAGCASTPTIRSSS